VASRRKTILISRRPLILACALLGLLLASCGGGDAGTSRTASPPAASLPSIAPGEILDVGRTVDWLRQEPKPTAVQPVDLIAQINPAPTQIQGSAAPPAGCPVFPDRLPTLTDHPFMTEFSVAGVVLPNPVPPDFAALRLVIPYRLGIIDVPPRARLRGHLLDPAYQTCPNADRIFVLDELVGSVPVAGSAGQSAQQSGGVVNAVMPWSSSLVGLGLDIPGGWSVQETRNAGSILEARFQSPDAARVVTLTVFAGVTSWAADSGIAPPAPLVGERRLVSHAGPATARLVDAVGDETPPGRNREIRLVFDYDGKTVVLSVRFIDGAALDGALLDRFTAMAASFHFDKPLEITDPLDPRLTARADLGSGPFIGKDTASAAAIRLSRLSKASVVSARLVSEKEAREAQAATCREFPERPEAVWLVDVKGTLPTGLQTERLVYLDATTGESICQAELSGTATP
jgi:hypothetical protein